MKYLGSLFKINSLRKKFILVVTSLLLLVFITEGLVGILNSIKETRRSLAKQAIAFAELSTKPLGEAYELYFNSGYYKFREVFQDKLSLDQDIYKVQFIDVNGQVIFDSEQMAEDQYSGTDYYIDDKEILDKIRSSKPTYMADSKISEEINEIYYPYISDWGGHFFTIRYYVSYEQVRENIIQIIEQSLILICLFFILAVILISLAVNMIILKPIAFVNSVIQRISQGKYEERIEIDTNDEIEQVADSANKMAKTLQQNILDLQELDKLKDEFIDIAAHHFRTPVTHIRFDLDYLKRKINSKISPKEKEVLADIESSNENLTLLIDDLLNITSLKKGKMKLVKFQPFDMKKIVKEAVQIYGQNAKKKKIIFKAAFDQKNPAEVLGDPPKIREVIGNLLDNAFKFTSEGGKVWLKFKELPQECIVTVEDTGIGISAEELTKIFNKFHRATDILTYDYEGRGLGLYISKLIIEAHNGRIWAKSQKGKGSKFSFSLPKNLPGSPAPQHIGAEE